MSLVAELHQLKQAFYDEKGKNSLFKKKKKEECARMISSKYPIEELAQVTFFSIPETNRVFFDYTTFKLFANHGNFAYLIKYVLFLFKETIRKYGNFVLDVNADTLTVSAVERYSAMIAYYCDECKNNENKHTDFANLMMIMNIYNTPSVIELIKTMLKPMTDPCVYSKLNMFSRENTDVIFQKIFKK